MSTWFLESMDAIRAMFGDMQPWHAVTSTCVFRCANNALENANELPLFEFFCSHKHNSYRNQLHWHKHYCSSVQYTSLQCADGVVVRLVSIWCVQCYLWYYWREETYSRLRASNRHLFWLDNLLWDNEHLAFVVSPDTTSTPCNRVPCPANGKGMYEMTKRIEDA